MYKNRFIKIVLLMFTTLMVVSCISGSNHDSSPVLASVGGEQLTVEMALSQIPDIALQQDTLEAFQNFKQQWINEKVTENEARRLGLTNDELYQTKLKRMEQQLLNEMLRQYVLAESEEELAVSRDEAQNYYQANRDKFILNERYVRFRHVTATTRTEIDNARRDLLRGVEWDDVLNNFSVNPDLQLRQSTQYLPISMAVSDIPMLNRYLNVIGLSEISPVHYANGQYHFVQLREIRNEGDNPDFDWLIPQIQQWLKLEKSKRITNAFKRNLYLQAESNNEIDQLRDEEMNSIINDYISTLELN
jgi:nucleoid-associated protein YgaU